MNNKYYNRLSSKIMPTHVDQHIQYVRHDLRVGTIRDLRFLDDDDWIKTAIGLTEFMLKAMTLGARPTNR
jgi:hypothetical protein